jgi:prevent-host-death family protein
MKTVSAREAARRFPKLLAQVEAGCEIVITRRNRVVARLIPAAARRKHKQKRIKDFLDSIKLPLGGYRFNRDELYERD